ncbi:class I SAM-dependent methyltransferase [Actinoplanes couchii]|uniref:class I SAM-dependent methyltransferase n=1 Tax=Actinoplanes couchii TaxID=403638 RepID=UPI001EF3894F|nr:class I SAM-dependent methyltransferase [Actinoplanes couchii]MDR6317151.1 SAM-dependent methyltransferase [Actinoplanes couchii]
MADREDPLVREVAGAYSAVSALYIDLFGGTTKVHADDLDLISRHLDRPGTVLDLGCGPGHYTAHLRALGVDAVGIDMVPEFVEHARAADPGGDYRLGSMRELAFDDRTIAGILVWYSLIHLPPDGLDPVLAELRRVLAPGGVLVAGFFDGDAVEAFDHKVITAYRWPAGEFAARLSAAGFTEIERRQRPAEGTHRAHAALVAETPAMINILGG